MKRLEKILVHTAGLLVALYAAIVLLCSLPFMQRTLANQVADVLSEQMKAKVDIGSVNLGFLNRIIIDDVIIHEPQGKPMASIARLSASINLFSLMGGQVDIGTAQLFGVDATLYRKTPQSSPNYQFLIDAFSSQDQEPAKVNLSIGSFIMRHANIRYDVLSEPLRNNRIDVNHIVLKDAGANIVLRCLTDDSLNVSARRLQGRELHSGCTLKDTRFRLEANRQEAFLSDFSLSLPSSSLMLDSLRVTYGQYEQSRKFRFTSSLVHGHVTPSDLACLQARLSQWDEGIDFSMKAEGNEQQVNLHSLEVSTNDQGLLLQMTAHWLHPLEKDSWSLHSDVRHLQLRADKLTLLSDLFVPQSEEKNLLATLGSIDYQGHIDYQAQGSLTSSGHAETAAGTLDYEADYDVAHWLTCKVHGDSINIGKLKNDPLFGTTSFDADCSLNMETRHSIPTGKLSGTVHNLYYKGYNYKNISLDAQSSPTLFKGMVSIDDENMRANAELSYSDVSAKNFVLDLMVEAFNPNRLNLTNEYRGESMSGSAHARLDGRDFQHLYGEVQVQDLRIATPTDIYHVDDITLTSQRTGTEESLYTVSSDFLNGSIRGEANLLNIAKSFTSQLACHLPAIFKSTETEKTDVTYQLTLTDHPVLHHFSDAEFSIPQPVRIQGAINSNMRQMSVLLNAPHISYNNNNYQGIELKCSTTQEGLRLNAQASVVKESNDDDVPPTSTVLNVSAVAHANQIVGDVKLNTEGRNNIRLQVLPVVQFSDSLGNLKTDITLRESNAVINDTTWTVAPSHVALYKKYIECHHVKFYNSNNSFLSIEGRASSSPNDSLVATLNNLEIKYLLTLVNFTVVRFAGQASGRAVVNNVLGGGVPDVEANLQVKDLSIQEGSLGDAEISAHWDKSVDGISVEGRMVDLYQSPDGLTGRKRNVTGITTVSGWVSPAKKDMDLRVATHNTNATFLHGFLRGVFREISGHVTGPVNIVGPFNNVNIIADVVPDMNLALRATGVPYHIEGDTIRMRHYLFDFKNISLYDRFGHRSMLNGQVTHRNMKNFTYRFDVDMHEMLAYDETEFNSDKFLATIFADGTLSIDGSDGHPLYVDASVTPAKGSVFAYDAATPDAITGNSFIEFRDRDSLLTLNLLQPEPRLEKEHTVEKDSLAIVKEAKKNYKSDIFINFDINLTPACEVKLRMDNVEDGYMRTFGNAKINAKWYNKGAFQMFGNYDISAGSYRLYLQDIIFRDLTLQPGSRVEFNGNPFDADIHLICHHTIHSVPLSDLTTTTAFSQNNKVRVVCILDITGKLGNMDFKFDMELPTVNEEVRQLVRSMINSEEEMNTQMIYLLGVGRFYPNEYARANGGDNSGQAANSLLSSTLSGQLNQMLSNVIGKSPNWNFGSMVTTGERGWNDLDVEGLLEGRLLDERLIINGAFGYRDNTMTNRSNFIGDFEVKWRMDRKGNLHVKAYNQTNDRYFTKSTLNTQGIGLSWRHDFDQPTRQRKEKVKKEKSRNSKKK